MNRTRSVDKVLLFASVLGLGSLLLGGFVVQRPNRLVDGVGIRLLEISGPSWLILLFWIFILSAVIPGVPAVFRRGAPGPLALAILPLSLFLAGGYASGVFRDAGPIARVSLGPAFWASLFSLAVVLSEAWRRTGWSRVLNGTAAAVSAAATLWLIVGGRLTHLSLLREFANREGRFFGETRTHIILALSAVLLAVVIGVPLGILAHRRTRIRNSVFLVLNSLQTIPSLALFGILIPLLAGLTAEFPGLEKIGIRGIGTAPALIALTLYSLLPVARNTFAGFQSIDRGIVEAAMGMGMTGNQLLLKVEFPIASPVLLSGIRTALVQSIGLTAVAALIGAGGYGVFIFQGLGQAATDLILLGAIPTIVVAVCADALMNGLIEVLRPGGLR